MRDVRLSVSHLSALQTEPAELVLLAAKAGYWAVGLRMNPAAPGTVSYPLRAGSAALAEVSRRMKDTGVAVYDVEFIQLTPTVDVASYAPIFEAAAELGAHRINVSGDDPDIERLSDHFATLCELAATYGLGVDLEFMRWRQIGQLQQAADVMRRAGCKNGGILIDTLHFFRSGSCVEELSDIEPGMLRSAQLSDAPAASPPESGIIDEARIDRLPPGLGELPLRRLIDASPINIAFAVEVPMPRAKGMLPLVHLKNVREMTEKLLRLPRGEGQG